MNDLDKMNLIAIVQQLPKDDIDFIETYISIMEEKITKLKRENNLLKADIEASQEIIGDYKKEEERLKDFMKRAKDRLIEIEKKYGYILDDVIFILDKENKQ